MGEQIEYQANCKYSGAAHTLNPENSNVYTTDEILSLKRAINNLSNNALMRSYDEKSAKPNDATRNDTSANPSDLDDHTSVLDSNDNIDNTDHDRTHPLLTEIMKQIKENQHGTASYIG